MIEEEQIVLLDEKTLDVIGSAPKLASHHSATPFHLAFSCWLFDQNGRILITQRALHKKVWPGVWTNSFCGHPLPGESIEQAVRRRAFYELNIDKISDLRSVLPGYRYKTPPFNGIIENEFCPVFFARVNGYSKDLLNPQEVAKFKFVSIDELKAALTNDPKKYSYWFKDQFTQLETVGLLG